ncbi:hypothetical protein GCM10010269_24320 [Streptomyces humidus]|uniref:Uncharacterized protein n=1 Tax=Streptomyces humidus TaxID=52259 RepID=A0A918FU01_9ACTN|nr:hypothetical protein GCM10010269_24320 [Streptomyces humidus]
MTGSRRAAVRVRPVIGGAARQAGAFLEARIPLPAPPAASAIVDRAGPRSRRPGAAGAGRRGPAGAAVAPLARVAGDVDEPVAVGSPPAGEGHAWRYCGQSRGREWVP